jgi:hypothetical protein
MGVAQNRHVGRVLVGGIGDRPHVMAPPLHLGREMQELAGEVLVDEEKLQASRSEGGGHQSFGIVGLTAW